MSNRVRLLATALILGSVVGGLAIPAAAETFIVQMTSVDFRPQFSPADLTIYPGDTVRWVNTDPTFIDHSTCSGAGSTDPNMGDAWNSGVLSANEVFEVTFPDEGDFEYFSVVHEFENMFGVVRVSDGATPVGEGVESSTWARIKQQFSVILPRD